MDGYIIRFFSTTGAPAPSPSHETFTSLTGARSRLRRELLRNPGMSAAIVRVDGAVAIYDQQLRSRFDWLREPDPDVAAPDGLRPAVPGSPRPDRAAAT